MFNGITKVFSALSLMATAIGDLTRTLSEANQQLRSRLGQAELEQDHPGQVLDHHQVNGDAAPIASATSNGRRARKTVGLTADRPA